VADHGLFIGWSNPVRGREQTSAAVFNEAIDLWTRWQADGTIESWEVAFLEPHGGDLDGFFLLRGERDKIALARASEDMQRLTTRAQLIVEGFGVVGASMGEQIPSLMELFLQSAAA
jgi:hypothetical protein